jgi:PASTA domain
VTDMHIAPQNSCACYGQLRVEPSIGHDGAGVDRAPRWIGLRAPISTRSSVRGNIMCFLRVTPLAAVAACTAIALAAPSAVAEVHGPSTDSIVSRNGFTYGGPSVATPATQLSGILFLAAASPSSTRLMPRCSPTSYVGTDALGNPCSSRDDRSGGDLGSCPHMSSAQTGDHDSVCQSPGNSSRGGGNGCRHGDSAQTGDHDSACQPSRNRSRGGGNECRHVSSVETGDHDNACQPSRNSPDGEGNRCPHGDSVVRVTVPNLVGQTVDRARVALRAAGLVLGSDLAAGRRVEVQKPAAGTPICPGSVVAVVVSEVIVAPPIPRPVPSVPHWVSPVVPREVPPAAPPVVPPVPPAVPHEVPPAPPVVPPVPPAPPVIPGVIPAVTISELIPWPWLIAALILLGVGLLTVLGGRVPHGQKWVRAHVRAVAGIAPDVDVEVMESRSDRSATTCVVRMEPHADSGTQILEEVHR